MYGRLPLNLKKDYLSGWQCHLSYSIKPFKDDVICDVAPLYVYDILPGQPYMYQCHGVYESRPWSVTIKLGGQKYRIPEVSPAHSASLISAKQCKRLIAQTGTFVLLMIHPEEQKKNVCNAKLDTLLIWYHESHCLKS